jgi:hypothetical protein
LALPSKQTPPTFSVIDVVLSSSSGLPSDQAARWGQERPEYFRCFMNFRVEMMRDPSAFPRAHQIRAQFLERAATTARQSMAEGDFRPDLDPTREVRMLFAVIDGLLMHAAIDVAFCPPAELADRVWQVVADRLLLAPGAP